MNTFLPCADFHKVARILDPERLNRQIAEVCVIARSLWAYERLLEINDRQVPWGFMLTPVLKLWVAQGSGAVCLPELRAYQDALHSEWKKHHGGRPHASMLTFNWSRVLSPAPRTHKLAWPEEVHESHRSKLMSKEPSYYRRAFARNDLHVPAADLPYAWEGPELR